MTATINVLVIDDNRLVREGLATLVDAQPEFTVVAAVETGTIGLKQVQDLRPHVAMVDATLGSSSSHRLVGSLRQTAPETRVIVMDLLPVPQDIIAFVKAGASGFIIKSATIDEVLQTLRTVAAGTDVVPPSLTGTLLSHIAEQAVVSRVAGVQDAARMTNREKEVIDLIAQGMSNKEIAQRLHLATYTVKSHVHNILEKMALHSRLQIAARAHRQGVTERRRSAP